MGLTTREIGSSAFNDMISSIDRRSEYVENRAGANVTTNNALISYGLSNNCSILNAPCGYSNGVYPSLTPIQTYSSELVTNGDFSDGTNDWSVEGFSNISVGDYEGRTDVANINISNTSSSSRIRQPFNYVNGKRYKVSVDVFVVSGSFRIDCSDSFVLGDFVSTSTTGSWLTLTAEIKAIQTGSNYIWLRGLLEVSQFYVDNVSIKEITDADFDFTRGSSATRVNEQGLVEDLQILSGELIQNGDFEQIGSELVTNGGFDNDSEWTKGLGWSIADGKATVTNSTTESIYQNILDTSKIYKTTFEITDITSGSLRIGIGINFSDYFTETGTYTYYGKPTTDGLLRINPSSGTNASIDNVSVKEVGQNWTFGTGWSIEDGKVYFNNPTGTELYQSLSTTASKYRISFDLDITSGTIQTSFSSPSVSTTKSFTTSGSKTVDITTTASFSRFRFVGLGGSVFNIDNISVVEVTDDTDLPRINYIDGEGSLLLEPQSTNLITYSEDYSQTDWSKTNISITTNSTISPDGTINASLLTENNSNAQHFIGDALSLTSGTSYSVSVYAKKKERSVLQISPSSSHIASSYANYDLDLGVVSATGGSVNAEIEYLSNDWYRCILKFTATNTATATLAFFMQTSTTALRGVSYQGDGTSGLYLWGAQAEALPYATSYIPTNGSTVTRLADVCKNSGNSDLINSTEGVLYAEISALANDGTNRALAISDGSTSNVVRFYYSVTDNRIVGNVKSGGTTVFNYNNVLTDATDFIKIAVSYKANDFKMYVNGTEVSTDTSGSAPTGLNELAFDNGAGNDEFYGNVKCVAVFKEALSDTELQKLTTI